MKRFWKTIILSMLLALTLCVGAQATENTMLKVGLKYGTNALFTARLQNYNDTLSGSGYELRLLRCRPQLRSARRDG